MTAIKHSKVEGRIQEVKQSINSDLRVYQDEEDEE
jgi:hypothetical protein